MHSKLKLRPYFLVFFLDIFIVGFVFFLSALFEKHFRGYDFNVPIIIAKSSIHSAIALCLWFFFKVYKRIIRHYFSSDFMNLIGVISLLHLITFTIYFFIYKSTFGVSLSLVLESFLATTLVLILIRYSISFLYEKFMLFQNQTGLKKIMIYGAGESGTILKKAIEASAQKKYIVLGFIDDDNNKISRVLLGAKIYSLQQAVDKFFVHSKVNSIIIATNKLTSKNKSNIVDIALEYKIKVKQVDTISNWLDTDFNLKRLQNINLNDLMGREAVQINNELIQEKLRDKTVFVTGAAGSIGRVLVRKLINNLADVIVCIDFSESALYDLQQEVIKSNRLSQVHFELADIRDRDYLNIIFNKYQPDLVFHAAAYKHVPMMEEFPWQSVATNVLGTWNVAKLSQEFNVEKFVLISTDKAVHPSSIMGLTKRLAEIIIRSLSTDLSPTKFIITRFGNVLDSNGSVVPLFKKQILSGGPVTVTHPDMERFFMTIPEACDLVLEAFTMGKGKEIFVFDMGKPVKIKDLAYNLIKLSGYIPEMDIKIVYTGIRKGEKLSEEMFTNRETFLSTYNKKIFISSESKFSLNVGTQIINELSQLRNYNVSEYKASLKSILEEAESSNLSIEEYKILEAI